MRTRFIRHAIRQPLHDLPVTPQPAVFPAAVSAVVRGIVLDHHDVCGQSGPGVCTLNQIMTEQGIPRKTVAKNARHRVHFVNPFSREGTFPEKILIHIGDGAGVGVKTGLTGEDGCQSRARCALHTDVHARLQNAISGNHDIIVGIHDRLIQRMGNRSHHAMGRSAREFRIGVERDDVSDLAKNREIAHFHREAVELAPHQPIEIEQFPPFALPPHPTSLARVINPMAMQKEKGAHILSGVAFIQFADQFFAQRNQSIVFRRGFR